ncbi:hypothetical protein ENSA5_07260 [Enhygromyxa salina]|uniref:Mechanosensitive ion channel n=1 Tax=Enhygromyxa salina TaxID=215803 RepID=A0A2S9YHA0_9BACT|nr:mechanosensitive ion channel [Enhygromyxa salina]PRQ04495.1 hypothetical protein ENSA5_07260 [Enhygromyxa salina]
MSQPIKPMFAGLAALLVVAVPRLAWASPPATEEAVEEAAEQGAGFFTAQWWNERVGALMSDDLLRTGLQLLLGLLLFIGGWLVAKLVAWVVFRILCKTDLDDKLAEKLGVRMLLEDRDERRDPDALERGVAKVVFYLLMALVVVGVLDFAGLEQAAGPIQGLVDTVIQALPLIGKAILILIVAYFAGLILRKIVIKAIDLARIDKRFAELDETPAEAAAVAETEAEVAARVEPAPRPFSQTAGQVVFWLVMIMGLAGAFDALQIRAISEPLSHAIDSLVSLLPALGVAALIVIGGWILAKIARIVITRALESLGFDRLVAKIRLRGLFGTMTPSAVVGWLVMAFIVIETVIAALDSVGLATLSDPMTDMMGQFWELLPALLVSILFVVVGVFVGRLLRGITQKTLESVGLDRLMTRLGFEFGKIAERDDDLGKASGLVGFVVQAVVVLLAIVQGLNNLDLHTWARYVDAFLVFAVTRAAVALVVVVLGFALGNYVRDLVEARQRGEQPEPTVEDERERSPVWLAEFARYAVLVFAFTMAVHQLGVAADFVLLSFALLFGALCLAGALAFGLGSREIATEIVRERYRKAKQGGGSSGPGAGSRFGSPLTKAPTKPPTK